MEDKALEALLGKHAAYFQLTPEGRVECTLNGHTFPQNALQIEAFINGKKYKKLKERKGAEASLEKYEPFLVQSINFDEMLYCALTTDLVAKSENAIKVHMRGKKFQRAQERFQQDKQELLEEPNMAEMEELEAEAGDMGIWVPAEVLAEHEEFKDEDEEGGEGDEEGEDEDIDIEEAAPDAGAAAEGGVGPMEDGEGQEAAAPAASKRARKAAGTEAAPAAAAAPKQRRKQKSGPAPPDARPPKKARAK